MGKISKQAIYENWIGEDVIIERTDEADSAKGVIKAAKNGALILVPTTGRKMPVFIEFSEIRSIRAVPIAKDTLPPVAPETIRAHMRKFHSWNSPWTPARELMSLHERLHRNEDGDSESGIGHHHS